MGTPIHDAYQLRINGLNEAEKLTDISKLVIGSYVNVPRSPRSSGCTGFAKKVNRVKVIIETTYGGMGGNDVSLIELTINKADIAEFYNPKF